MQSAKPHTKGTTERCRLPYIKNPIPTELNRSPHSSLDSLMSALPDDADGSSAGRLGDYSGDYLLSLATSQVTSSIVCSSPPADATTRRYLPFTMMVGVRSTP